MTDTSLVSKSGATTAPRSIRKALGLQPGDRLDWQVLRDGTLVCQHKPADPQRATVHAVSAVLGRQ